MIVHNVEQNSDAWVKCRLGIPTASAFDRILCAVPFKGQVLTQTARFWFEATADICPNHVLDYPDPNVVIARRLDDEDASSNCTPRA